MTGASKKKPPFVAIVGRSNVGKSTLFNRIIGKQRAIVHDREAITRDRFISEAAWYGRRFRLVDTGGLMEDPTDVILRKMQEQAQRAIAEAAVVIFVLDGQAELTRSDHTVAEMLLRRNKPVVLAVNKLDNPKLAMNQYEYYALGLGDPLPISASHNLGTDELMRAVVAQLPESAASAAIDPEATEGTAGPAPVKVAIVGRPNVGKSSFINALLNEERAIVSEIPGTTRDAIDVEFRRGDREYLLIDTAGLRRKSGIRDAVEHFSVARSLRAARRADVCLIMVEASEGLAEQDKRIIGYAMEQGVAFILVWTKWDLIEQKERRLKALEEDLDLKMPQAKFAPRVTVSSVTRQRLYQVFELVDRVAADAEKRVPTAELNRLIESIKARHTPPSRKGRHAKILYATQASVKPTVFVLFVNQKQLFHFSYLRFIENCLRDAHGFEGVPIRLELREEGPKT